MSQTTIPFDVADHRKLTPLSNTWKHAVSISIDAAFSGKHNIMRAAYDLEMTNIALYDISDYYKEKKAPAATDNDCLKTAQILNRILEL